MYTHITSRPDIHGCKAYLVNQRFSIIVDPTGKTIGWESEPFIEIADLNGTPEEDPQRVFAGMEAYSQITALISTHEAL